MVQQYQSPVRVYKYPFELVMAAYERRFPTCPMIPVFVGSDILADDKSPDGATQVVERRCKLNIDAPYLLKKIVGVDYVHFIQKNSLDRRNRQLVIEAFNESFSSRIIIHERCTYSVHPENPAWTCFEQMASLDVKSFFGFENTVEKIAMKQYSQNISKGKEIIEHFIAELKNEGITYVPPWRETLPPTKLEPPENEVRELSGSNPSTGSAEDMNLGASASDLTNLSTSVEKCQLQTGDGQYQLEAEYIQRCLGELSPLQESRLVQLKKWVADLQKGKMPSDGMLLRFLRARDFNVEKAREMLSQSLIWRKKYSVDRLLSEYKMPQVVRDYFPGGWHHCDKEGRPLYLLRLGQMDVKGLVKTVGEEGLLKLTLHVCEEGLNLTEEATQKLGRPISTWTLLVDLEGLNMRHLWRPGIRALLRIIEIVEANYPETMGRVLVVRAPRVFPILWTLVSTFIDENTRTKFLFYSCNEAQETIGLKSFVPEEYIPDFLGGQCQTAILEGGLVPKSLYMCDEDLEREVAEGSALREDSIYHSVTLARGQVHEVLIQNEDPGCVITWDFDVMKQDVAFGVLRTSLPVRGSKDYSVVPKLSAGQAVTKQPSLPPPPIESEHKSVIDKSWQEGKEYFKVEMPVVCHDGESIQGSHVTSYPGTYILQWRFHEPPHGHNIMDSISTHKAKLMYFYDTLRSADYRGSMSSLHSGNSGLSSRSAISSCPSR